MDNDETNGWKVRILFFVLTFVLVFGAITSAKGADNQTILTGGTVDPSDDIIVTDLAPKFPTGGGQDSSQPDFPTGGGTVVIRGQPGGQPSTSPVQEAERIRNVMEARKQGANIGFSAGGLASLPRYLKGR